MLDGVHESLPINPHDSNTYLLGRIGQHNIAIACLPTDGYGTNNAATVANNMQRTFPSIRISLMVGIGGGIPGTDDIRLGDVVVSNEVVQYDLGKTIPNGFRRTGTPYKPSQFLRGAVSRLRAAHELGPSKIPSIISEAREQHSSMTKYFDRGTLEDKLFNSTYDHIESVINCEHCDKRELVQRPVRSNNNPQIHYGIIASGNQVIKYGKARDKLAQELGAICFEMEAAGLIEISQGLVIRGICDYSDSHKNKQWQEYAAATAAAYAKELLSVLSNDKVTNIPTTVTISDNELQKRRRVLLSSLKFEQISSREASINDAYAKTCEWLLNHPTYIDWLDPDKFDQHYGFLWISGKPGAGKSTLMKFAYTYAKRKSTKNEVIVSFFFNARGHDLEKSVMGMYRSLLVQLLEKLPSLQKVLDRLNHPVLDFTDTPKWNIEMLRHLFQNVIAELTQQRLTCYIDALDECDEQEIRAMVRYFEVLGKEAAQNGTKLYICFSSRHYPYIDIQNGQRLILEDQDGHGQDLEEYVRYNLRTGTGDLLEDVKIKILQKAAGVFMWVVLVVDILNKEFERGRIFAAKKRLQEIPSELSKLFKDIIRRDNENMEDLLLSIQWVLFSKRPLKPEEFYFAVVSGLAPDPENLAEWDPKLISKDDINRFVLSSSKGLAEVTKSKEKTVQFIHESVRDFLIKDNGLLDLWPELGEYFQSLSHDRLKQCCEAYIKVDISSYIHGETPLPKASSGSAKYLQRLISRKFPFLEYATYYVLHHAETAARRYPQDTFIERFDLNSWIPLNNLFEKFEIRRHELETSLLYILADNGLARLITTTLHHDPNINIHGGRYEYPFFAALANGHRDAIKALLRKEDNYFQDDNTFTGLEYGQVFAINRGPRLLSMLLEKKHTILAKLLITYIPFNLHLKDHEGRTPFSYAAAYGSLDVIQFLLDKRVSIDSSDAYGRTPLSYAAAHNDLEVVRLLLDKGVNIESTNEDGETALLIASESEHLDIVQLLLDKGANIESTNEDGETALLIASGCWHLDIVRLLLDKGADVKPRDKDDWTALSLTFSYKIVHLLRERGARR